jgi:hypothetical protein
MLMPVDVLRGQKVPLLRLLEYELAHGEKRLIIGKIMGRRALYSQEYDEDDPGDPYHLLYPAWIRLRSRDS